MTSTQETEVPTEEKQADSKIAPEALIKHPLHSSWTLWFLDQDRKRAWGETLREIISINTVEDFWSVYHHIKSASQLKSGWDYSLFKTGIKPMWEDAANENGGRWLLNLDKNQRDELDNYWLDTMLCLIGEAFEEHSDYVCGATVNVRPKGDKIGVWTSDADASKKDVNLFIGHVFKERLKIKLPVTIAYQCHKDTNNKTGSSTKSVLII